MQIMGDYFSVGIKSSTNLSIPESDRFGFYEEL